MVDRSTQTETLSGRDDTAKWSVATPKIVPGAVPATAAAAPPASFLDDLDNLVATQMTRPAPRELWQTPGYADIDADRRHMMLNDFICQNLENPDFLQLCVDTEHAWRRIGFGM